MISGDRLFLSPAGILVAGIPMGQILNGGFDQFFCNSQFLVLEGPESLPRGAPTDKSAADQKLTVKLVPSFQRLLSKGLLMVRTWVRSQTRQSGRFGYRPGRVFRTVCLRPCYDFPVSRGLWL